MSNNVLDQFYQKKKDDSAYIALEDGQSVEVAVKRIKTITKAGFDGEETEVLRLVCEVETDNGKREKFFDNGSMRWAKELRDKKVVEGASFKITRDGEGPQTAYTISELALPAGTPVEQAA
jgi:hypothetical protein